MKFVSVYRMMKVGAGGGNTYTMNIFGRSVLTPLHISLKLVLFEFLEKNKSSMQKLKFNGNSEVLSESQNSV